jgi:hypothetical protein
MYKALVGMLGMTLVGGCAADGTETMLGFNGEAHMVVTRVGVALPSGRLKVDAFTPDLYQATFTNGDATIEVTSRFEKRHLAVCDVAFDRDRHLTLTIDYLTGEISYAGNLILTKDDIFNLARLDMAIGEDDDTLRVGVDDPRRALTSFIAYVGMGYPGASLDGLRRQFDTLKLFDADSQSFRVLMPDLAEAQPARGEPRIELPTMPADAVVPGLYYPDPPSGLIAYPPYTGPFIGTGGTGIKCVTEGHYYAIGFDWRKRVFGTRHKVNMYAPVMPRAYTLAQSDARYGWLCNGLVGPNCAWGTGYGWTLDALRHDTCQRVTHASATISIKCGDELADCADDATLGSQSCNGTTTYTTTGRVAFASWTPHYPGQPDTCGNGVCNSGETTTTCPADCHGAMSTLTSCGNGECGGTEDSNNCPGDCGPPNCGDLTCSTGETSSNCPDDCGDAICGNSVCVSSVETAAECPQDCGFIGFFRTGTSYPLSASTSNYFQSTTSTASVDATPTPAPVTFSLMSGSCPNGAYANGNRWDCHGTPAGQQVTVRMTRSGGYTQTVTFVRSY